MLCDQMHKTTNQLQKVLRGKIRNRNRNERKRPSGSSTRSGKTKKRATDEATAAATAKIRKPPVTTDTSVCIHGAVNDDAAIIPADGGGAEGVDDPVNVPAAASVLLTLSAGVSTDLPAATLVPPTGLTVGS